MNVCCICISCGIIRIISVISIRNHPDYLHKFLLLLSVASCNNNRWSSNTFWQASINWGKGLPRKWKCPFLSFDFWGPFVVCGNDKMKYFCSAKVESCHCNSQTLFTYCRVALTMMIILTWWCRCALWQSGQLSLISKKGNQGAAKDSLVSSHKTFAPTFRLGGKRKDIDDKKNMFKIN